MTKKLRLETKIRDAAISLTRVNASHKKISKQTDEQLEAANRRVDVAQKELWRVSERLNEVQKRLLEHRAGVLSYSVRSMEKKMAPQVNGDGEDSGYDTPSHRGAPMSPTTSSMTGMSTSSRKPRFDGAHLFAGHADAVVPKRGRSPATTGEMIELEEKLKAATESLTAAGKKQGEMSRELSLLRLEKEEVETMMGMDLQSAEETINALEKELPRLESLETQLNGLIEEKSGWEKEREELAKRSQEAERRLVDLEEQNGQALGIEGVLAEERESNRRKLEEKENDIAELRAQLERDRNDWEQEKAALEDEKMEDLARLQDEMDKLREADVSALQKAQTELEQGVVALRTLMQTHSVSLFSGDSSLQGLLSAVGTHISSSSEKIENHTRAQAEWETLRRKLEEDVRNGLDKRESLARELEEARRERETVRKEVRSLEDQVKVSRLVLILLLDAHVIYSTSLIVSPSFGHHHQPMSPFRLNILAMLGRSSLSSSPSGPFYHLPKPEPQSSLVKDNSAPDPGLQRQAVTFRLYLTWTCAHSSLSMTIGLWLLHPRIKRHSPSKHSLPECRHLSLTTVHLSSDSFGLLKRMIF